MIKLMDIIREIEYPMAQGEDLQSYEDVAGWKGKIIWMSPDKFLSLAYPLINPISKSLKSIEDKMKVGHPIDPLTLWIDVQRRKVAGHEGRHRATVAKKLGIEKIPVLIIVEKWRDMGTRVPKWTKAQHDFVDKAEFGSEG